ARRHRARPSHTRCGIAPAWISRPSSRRPPLACVPCHHSRLTHDQVMSRLILGRPQRIGKVTTQERGGGSQMRGGLILAAALVGQSAVQPATKSADPDAREVAAAFRDHAGENERASLVARRKAKRAARYTARVNRETAEAIAEARAIEQAKKEYLQMLP